MTWLFPAGVAMVRAIIEAPFFWPLFSGGIYEMAHCRMMAKAPTAQNFMRVMYNHPQLVIEGCHDRQDRQY